MLASLCVRCLLGHRNEGLDTRNEGLDPMDEAAPLAEAAVTAPASL
jgi:hypothetical protein